MPIYEYRCGSCTQRVAVLVRSAGASPVCPECGALLTDKLFSAPNIINSQNRRPSGRHCDEPGHSCCGQRQSDGPLPCSEGDGCRCHN